MSSRIVNGFDELLEDKRSEIDLDADIEDQYDVILFGMQTLEALLSAGGADDLRGILEEADDRIRREINEVLQEQEEHRAAQEDDGDWDVFSPSKLTPTARDEKSEPSLRSIFFDLDGAQ